MIFDPSTRVRTNVDDCDTDAKGNERLIPVGTLGTIHDLDGDLYNIVWDNGAWTRWTEEELARDATILNC